MMTLSLISVCDRATYTPRILKSKKGYAMYLLDTNILSELVKKSPNKNLIFRLEVHSLGSPLYDQHLCDGVEIWRYTKGKSRRPLDED